MDIKEIAKILNNCQIGNEVSDEIKLKAKENNIVIVFGASDDLMEFRGAIDDELGAYGGRTAYIDKNGLVENLCDDRDCPYYQKIVENATEINAYWCKTEECDWTYVTSIPHETFDVLKDDEIYCKGIVFSLDNLI